MATEMTKVTAIKTFFEADGGRKVTMEEFKRLSKADLEELGELAANAIKDAEDQSVPAEANGDEYPASHEPDESAQEPIEEAANVA